MPVHRARPIDHSASVRRQTVFGLATSAAFERAVCRVPGGRERAWRSARRYVAGEAAADAIAVARALDAAGIGASIDLFGERTDAAAAPEVAERYVALATRLAAETATRTWLSLDLSHIAFDAALLHTIAATVPPGRRLQIGAEEAAAADRVLELVTGAARHGWPIEATLQANLRRSPGDADRLAAAGVPVRLVKGAYVESTADALPLGTPTDRAYAALARKLHLAVADVALATHDALLRATLLAEMPAARCELLLGIDPAGARRLAAAGHDVRVYVPFGRDWFRYFMRRRAEAQGA
jgi:proline dehydrogenase